MFHQSSNRSRRLSLEALEIRQLMAGDLSAVVVNGDLLISGGVLSNGVQITAGATPGTVQVSGLPQAGTETRINHQRGPQTFAVAHDVVIDLDAGDDVVKVQNVRLPGNLKIRLGEGSDAVTIDNTNVARSLTLDAGDGNDSVNLSHDNIHGKLEANLGHGDDYFSLLGSHLYGNVDLNTGWNADRVAVQDSVVDYAMTIRGEASFAAKEVTLTNVQVRLALSVQTGDGKDNVRLASVTANEIDIVTGAGNDRVNLDWVTADHLDVQLGDGDDRLSVGNSSARLANLHGGLGTNLFSQPYRNTFRTLNLTRFSI